MRSRCSTPVGQEANEQEKTRLLNTCKLLMQATSIRSIRTVPHKHKMKTMESLDTVLGESQHC